jgi:hypothetical protein
MSNTPNKDSVEERKIYLRVYDGKPVGYSDEKLRNEFLGTFAVEQVMFEDMYSEEFIGKRKEDGKHYIVTGIEVSGMRNPSIGGIRYEIKEIKLDNLLSQTRTEVIEEALAILKRIPIGKPQNGGVDYCTAANLHEAEQLITSLKKKL